MALKRTARFAISRGVALTITNWPLLLVPIGESIVLFVTAPGASEVLSRMLVAAGLGTLASPKAGLPSSNDLRLAFTNHWPQLLLTLVFVIGVGLLLVALHSFCQAGAADVYVAADRENVRFTLARWFRGGTRGWQRVLCIYAIWLVVAVVLFVPLVPIPFLSVGLGGGLAPCVMIVGCVLLALWGCLAAFVIVMTFIWTLKAIVVAMAQNRRSSEAFGYALVSIGSNPLAHMGIALLMVLIWIGGLALVGRLVRGDLSLADFRANPAELLLWLVGIFFSSVMQNWLLASYSVLTEPDKIGRNDG